MLIRQWKRLKKFFTITVPERNKTEFKISVAKSNLLRGKVTALTFIVLEIIQFVPLYVRNQGDFSEHSVLYRRGMYLGMIAAMVLYLIAFCRLERKVSKHLSAIQVVGVSFGVFLLSWCAGLSLLDQLSYGQIIVYSVAILCVAMVPIYPPITLLFIYVAVQTGFILLMPKFQASGSILYGNIINSTSFVLLAWAMSCMMYQSTIHNFNNRKLVQEKGEQLKAVNEQLEAVNQKLEKLSCTDGLTDVFNRSFFDRTLEAEWDRCRRHFIPLSLIILDIDFFKEYNDNYGHPAGDACLKQVASALAACARRSSDVVTRYGGDEFTVILPHTEAQNALELAEQIAERVRAARISHAYSRVSDCVTLSMGIFTMVPSGESTVEEFIRNADRALYEAKKERDKICVYQRKETESDCDFAYPVKYLEIDIK